MSSWVCGGSPGFRPDLFVQAAVWMRRAVSSSWNQGENCRLSLIKKEINKRSWVTRVARSVRSTSMDTLTVIYLKTRWSLPSKHCFTHDSRRLKPNVVFLSPPTGCWTHLKRHRWCRSRALLWELQQFWGEASTCFLLFHISQEVSTDMITSIKRSNQKEHCVAWL